MPDIYNDDNTRAFDSWIDQNQGSLYGTWKHETRPPADPYRGYNDPATGTPYVSDSSGSADDVENMFGNTLTPAQKIAVSGYIRDLRSRDPGRVASAKMNLAYFQNYARENAIKRPGAASDMSLPDWIRASAPPPAPQVQVAARPMNENDMGFNRGGALNFTPNPRYGTPNYYGSRYESFSKEAPRATMGPITAAAPYMPPINANAPTPMALIEANQKLVNAQLDANRMAATGEKTYPGMTVGRYDESGKPLIERKVAGIKKPDILAWLPSPTENPNNIHEKVLAGQKWITDNPGNPYVQNVQDRITALQNAAPKFQAQYDAFVKDAQTDFENRFYDKRDNPRYVDPAKFDEAFKGWAKRWAAKGLDTNPDSPGGVYQRADLDNYKTLSASYVATLNLEKDKLKADTAKVNASLEQSPQKIRDKMRAKYASLTIYKSNIPGQRVQYEENPFKKYAAAVAAAQEYGQDATDPAVLMDAAANLTENDIAVVYLKRLPAQQAANKLRAGLQAGELSQEEFDTMWDQIGLSEWVKK